LCRQLANGLLAVVVLVSGYNLMLRPHMGGATYAGSLELIPRLLLGGILINTAAGWCRLAIDPNNAMCVYGTEQIGVSDRHLVLSQLIARAQRQRGLAEASWGDDDDVLPASRIADQTPGLGEAVGEELGGGDSTIVKGIVSQLAASIMPKA